MTVCMTRRVQLKQKLFQTKKQLAMDLKSHSNSSVNDQFSPYGWIKVFTGWKYSYVRFCHATPIFFRRSCANTFSFNVLSISPAVYSQSIVNTNSSCLHTFIEENKYLENDIGIIRINPIVWEKLDQRCWDKMCWY